MPLNLRDIKKLVRMYFLKSYHLRVGCIDTFLQGKCDHSCENPYYINLPYNIKGHILIIFFLIPVCVIMQESSIPH